MKTENDYYDMPIRDRIEAMMRGDVLEYYGGHITYYDEQIDKNSTPFRFKDRYQKVSDLFHYWHMPCRIKQKEEKIPNENTPKDTLCEVWNDDRKQSVKRYLAYVVPENETYNSVFLCVCVNGRQKTTENAYTSIWENAVIIEEK